ncbi:hypothetical protein TNCV_533921 [Trichonephila clavipes]|nr:hypothetical protein TNCV_533921 [Trichonephila clavipes]
MYSAFAAWEYFKQQSSRKSSREVGGRGREVGASDHPPGCSQSKLRWNRAKLTCMVPKAKANEKRKNLALNRDEFRGP